MPEKQNRGVILLSGKEVCNPVLSRLDADRTSWEVVCRSFGRAEEFAAAVDVLPAGIIADKSLAVCKGADIIVPVVIEHLARGCDVCCSADCMIHRRRLFGKVGGRGVCFRIDAAAVLVDIEKSVCRLYPCSAVRKVADFLVALNVERTAEEVDVIGAGFVADSGKSRKPELTDFQKAGFINRRAVKYMVRFVRTGEWKFHKKS